MRPVTLKAYHALSRGASRRAVALKPLAAEICTHEATEGTPLALIAKSMYMPGGARFPFAGPVTVSPPDVWGEISGT